MYRPEDNRAPDSTLAWAEAYEDEEGIHIVGYLPPGTPTISATADAANGRKGRHRRTAVLLSLPVVVASLVVFAFVLARGPDAGSHPVRPGVERHQVAGVDEPDSLHGAVKG